MQRVENKIVSLRALDGGLADASIRAALAEGSASEPKTVAVVSALERILTASSAGIPLRTTTNANRTDGRISPCSAR